jgi:hypothetical protein
MGCAGSRGSSAESEEERLIAIHVASLGFSKHPAQVIESQIKRETANGPLTLPKINRLMTSLQVTLPLDRPESSCVKFFDRLKVEGVICSNRLVIAGLLLGSGSLQKRAQLLFEHTDNEAKGILERSEVNKLLDEIIVTAVDILPVLAYSEAHEARLKVYQARLLNSQSALTQLALTDLMQEAQSISQAQFVTALSKPELKYWLDPLQLRKELLKSRDDVLTSMKRTYVNSGEAKKLFFKRPPGKSAYPQASSTVNQTTFGQGAPSGVKKQPSPQKPNEELKPVECFEESKQATRLETSQEASSKEALKASLSS